MEASQASEAGSIPVARSTPRPAARRAVLLWLCEMRAYNGDRRTHQHTRESRCTTASCSADPHRCRHGGRTPPTRPGAMSVGARKFAQQGACSGSSAKKLAQQGQKHRIWGVLSTQGELFRAFALKQCRRANFFAPGTATTRNLNIQGHDDALTLST